MHTRAKVALATLAVCGAGIVSSPALPGLPADEFAEWDLAPLYHDWRLSHVMRGAAYTALGTRIGSVNDVTIASDGTIDSVIIKTGGRLDQGHLIEVPWQDVDFDPTLFSVTINSTAYTLADKNKKQFAWKFLENGEWLGSQLTNLTVNLDGQAPFGKVNDILFSPGGHLSSYIVEPDGNFDLFAVPWEGEWIDGDGETVMLPYTDDLILQHPPFVYWQMDS